MPIGTLTRKIQCQVNRPVSTPPSSTPTAPPPDITNPKTPIALARSPGSENRPMIRASATAETAAPPRPWTARPTTRNSAVGANAQATDADGEGGHAAEQHPAVAVQVAEPARQQQEAAEGQHVGVDHPGQRLGGEAEVGLDGREGDVHDVGVEHDHQVAEAQRVQRQPAGAAFVHRRSSLGWCGRWSRHHHERGTRDPTVRRNFPGSYAVLDPRHRPGTHRPACFAASPPRGGRRGGGRRSGQPWFCSRDVDHPGDAEPVGSMPNSSPHICFSSGIITWPPSASLSQ